MPELDSSGQPWRITADGRHIGTHNGGDYCLEWLPVPERREPAAAKPRPALADPAPAHAERDRDDQHKLRHPATPCVVIDADHADTDFDGAPGTAPAAGHQVGHSFAYAGPELPEPVTPDTEAEA